MHQRKKKKNAGTSAKVPEIEASVSLTVEPSVSNAPSVADKGKRKMVSESDSDKMKPTRRTTISQVVVDALVELSGSAPLKDTAKDKVEQSSVKSTKSKKVVQKRTLQIRGPSKSPTSKENGTPPSLIFRNEDAMLRWDSIVGRNFLREHTLRPSSISEYGILEMLESVGLSKTALNV